ncbi:MAG: ABC transporter permease, partial [Flavisolibacter sp.]|nr:ABC transporter permease [Flavisolibacter sp.]
MSRKNKNLFSSDTSQISFWRNKKLSFCILFFVFAFISITAIGQTATKVKPLPPVSLGKDGHLVYAPDSLGNRVPDFSYAGYRAGEAPIPDVPIRVVVPVTKGDATVRIQSALDYVASLPADKDGVRGAVLLEKGRYDVAGTLKLNAFGVVLRGSGMGEEGTVLFGAGKDRETLIKIVGKDDRKIGPEIKITDAYVPVNATKLTIATPQDFKAGDAVLIHRPSTEEWIETLGTDHFGGGITALGWKPGQRDLWSDRKVVAVEGQSIIVDAPITTALDAQYGGGTIAHYSWPSRISQIGIENLRCVSAYDKSNPKDEAHRWMAITMENVSDAWVRQITFEHFAGSAVAVYETAKRITVEDCKALTPVSEIGGQRRYTFFTSGQQVLFQRCYAEHGYHDFAVGFCAAGPNAFVQCESHRPYSFSGAIDSWASGVLFDVVNVDGQALSYLNRWQEEQGAGWSAANSVFWQCTAARVDCYKPPTANNYAFGTWAQFSGDGYWGESNNHIHPRSLYYGQLFDRLGDKTVQRAQLIPVSTEASSSPSVAVANELTALAVTPAILLKDWIDKASERQRIPTNYSGIKSIDAIGITKPSTTTSAGNVHITNGWLVRGTTVQTGSRQEVAWWNGSARPYALGDMKPHITRYVPGRTGTGLTDDLDDVTDAMQQKHVLAMEHNYGLWYDRRRDDHERVRRMNGEVWPPFYELPFARSGKDTAWDGLSKYDLTKYNHWYWSRLKHFADLADQKGLILVHQQYMQHNIIEAGAHYADFPWRPVNNVNNTGFPEPVPYAGDKRIFMAAQFYDVKHPVRRQLHRAYIRQCLDNFKDNTGVIQLI